MDDLNILRRAVHEEFEVIHSEDKVESTALEAFGYMSHHYICKIKEKSAGRRYEGLHELKFEVQCRTLLMDSWANVSHYLYYKGESSVPRALRKDFHALSGLLHVADRQFQHLHREVAKSIEDATSVLEETGKTPDDEVNLSNVLALLQQKYPDRGRAGPERVSTFVEELAAAGIYSMSELEGLFDESYERALRYEEKNPPMGEAGRKFADVGIARHSVALGHERYRTQKYGPDKSFDD